MVAIKDMKETPKDCKKCPLMGTDGTPTDYFKPMMCVAIWATKHKIKHCIGGKIRDDCPLVDIEERKVVKCTDCNEYNQEKHYCPKFCDVIRDNTKELQEFYKGEHEKLEKIEQIVNEWNNDASHSFSDMCKINEILKQELNTFKLEMELKF